MSMLSRTAKVPRRVAAAAVTSLLAASVAACGGGGISGDTVVLRELDYYTSGPASKAMDRLLQTCGNEVGVEIKRQSIPRNQLITQVLQQASSQSLPALLVLDNPDLPRIAKTGALTSLESYDYQPENYYDSVLSAGRYNGKTYGLSLGVNTIGLFYNKDMLDKAGVQPPETWDELMTAAQKLTQGDTYGMSFSAPATEEATWQFLPFFWTSGATLSKLDSPEAVKALKFWDRIAKRGYASQSVVNWTQADLTDQFLSGHAAMMVNGPWAIPKLDEKKSLDYGVVPIPAPQKATKPTIPLGGEVWTVPRTSETKQKKAWQVIQCFNQSQNMLKWANASGRLPTKPDVAKQVDGPKLEKFVDMIPQLRARTAKLGTRYSTTSKELWTAIQASLIDKAPPQQALTSAQQQVRQSP